MQRVVINCLVIFLKTLQFVNIASVDRLTVLLTGETTEPGILGNLPSQYSRTHMNARADHSDAVL